MPRYLISITKNTIFSEHRIILLVILVFPIYYIEMLKYINANIFYLCLIHSILLDIYIIFYIYTFYSSFPLTCLNWKTTTMHSSFIGESSTPHLSPLYPTKQQNKSTGIETDKEAAQPVLDEENKVQLEINRAVE